MAIEWMDAFDLGSAAAIAARYDLSTGSGDWTLSASGGRTNQHVLMGAGDVTKYRRDNANNLIPSDGIIVSLAHKLDTWDTQSGCQIITLKDSAGAVQMCLKENFEGSLSVYRGNSSTGTLLGTTAVLSEGFWLHYEFKVIIHSTNGSFTVRVDEVTLLSASGVNTQNTALTNVGQVQIGGKGTNGASVTNSRFDDFLIANLSEPIPASGFYGNIKIEHMPTDGAGSATQWSPFPSNVSNWDNLNDNPHDSDTSYNYASTENYSDLYSMQNMSAGSGDVRAVQISHASMKEDALTRVVAPLIRSGAVTTAGNNDSLTTSYLFYTEIYNFNPTTSDYFTIAETNSLECGIRLIT